MNTNKMYNYSKLTVIELFQSAVKKFANLPAVKYNDQSLTYQQLNQKVNQLSHYLLSKGIKKGDIVNIVLQRSIHTIISIFAVLKCGAIYVPIDPAYPAERIRFMASDSEASFLITSSIHQGLLLTSAKEIVIESVLKKIEDTAAHNPDVSIDLNDVMYILYTSGSTGKPKGTLICHRNMLSFLKGIQNIFKVNESCRMLSVASVSFDASCGDYYFGLTNGHTIVLANAEVVKDGKKLLSLMKSEKIDLLRATPSTYKLLIDSGWQEKLPITLLSGGEQLTPFMAKNLLGKCNSLNNMYGPTETTVNVTQAHITSVEDITIGRPFYNTPVYILDENLNPVPNGEPGELFIGGDNVGLGYFKRPELTAEKFLPDPFVPQPEKTMYRTGDLVKYDAQGKIVFLGRLDNQGKIRGYRIELGEIEQLLLEQSDVKECIVRAKENHLQDKVLVAYVVVKNKERVGNDAVLISNWKKELGLKLPPFMIPAYFFLLINGHY